MSNRIDTIRSTSTFDSFEPQDEAQEGVRDGLRRLADQVAKQLVTAGSLDHARLINLHGAPGRGKTHLVEAFANHIKGKPGIAGKKNPPLYMIRGGNLSHWLYNEGIVKKPVLIVDDLFHDSSSLARVYDNDIKAVMNGLYRSYEAQQLVLVTSNFPTDGILERIRAIDDVGRITSRIAEMSLSTIEVKGDDYREIISRRRALNPDPFSL